MGQITTEFSKSVEQYIVSMRNVRIEMESVLERYNSVSTRIEDKLGQVESELKTTIEQLGSNVDEKSKAILEGHNTLSSKIEEQCGIINEELKADTNKISSEIASSKADNKESARKMNDKIDSVVLQILNAIRRLT